MNPVAADSEPAPVDTVSSHEVQSASGRHERADSNEMRCQLHTDSDAWAALAPIWDQLLAGSSANELVLSVPWQSAWWKTFGHLQGRRLRAASFYAGDVVIGIAPLLRRTIWHRGFVPVRRLEFIGSGEPTRDSVCSEYLNFIVRDGWNEPFARRLASALAENAFGPWDELMVPLMDGEHPLMADICDACRSVGLTVELTETMQAPFIALPASWEDYLATLTKKHRQGIRYTLRDFDAWAGEDQALHEATKFDDLEQGIRILTALHKFRWDGADGGTFSSPGFLAFHHHAIAELHRRGAVQLLWLSVKGVPTAAMLNFVWNNKVYFYQSGRNPNVPQGLRPGGVIIAKAIQLAIQRGRREFDFLGGASVYKMQLASKTRPLVQLLISRNGIRERVKSVVEKGVGVARWIRNRVRGRRKDAVVASGSSRHHPSSGLSK